MRIGRQTLLPCSERLLRSVQDPSTRSYHSLGRDDMDRPKNVLLPFQNFTFYILHLPFKKRSFVAALLRMTWGAPRAPRGADAAGPSAPSKSTKNSRALRRGLGVMQMKMPAKRRREPFYTIYLSSAAGALSSSARLASYPFLPRSAKVACLPASTPGWLKVSMLNMAPA